MIHIKNVTFIKSGKKLLQRFSLKIEDGEHYVITGANGSGKTTLLELIAGSSHCSKGEIDYDFIQGNTWEERYWDKKKKIHFIHTHAIQQFLNNSSDLYYQQRYYGSVNDNILTVRDVLGTDIEKFYSLEIPSSLNIHHLLTLEIDKLSNGQLKKLLLVQSLLKDKPKVMLLDYPFEGLDSASRQDLCSFIDLMAITYSIQVILVDQHHQLPSVITRRLVMDNLKIRKEEQIRQNNGRGVIVKKPIQKVMKSTSANPIIDMRDLKIQYGKSVILENFNWIVHRGERWALTGRNGSGKTTVFSFIFADHPKAYGQQIYLFGRRRGTGESIWDIKKRITYLGPELINYINSKSILLSAKEYIKSLNKVLDEEKLEEIVRYFHADDFIDRPVKFLSSGQLQLAFVMNAFLADEELLLLDEPFQFLDSEQKERMSIYLQYHLHADTTLILISHYEEDIASWTQLTKKIG